MVFDRRWLVLALAGALGLAAGSRAQETTTMYPDRWVYVSRNLTKDEHVEDVRGIAATAQAHGLNGMLFAAGLESVGRWQPDRLARLDRVKEICRENRIEIIPIIWSVGYGSCLGVDANLAEGLPCTDVPFKVQGGEARFVAESATQVVNGGFEEYTDNRMAGYAFHDDPGKVSFADTAVVHTGKASLRFENFGTNPHGHARVMQELTVRPQRQYRISCWVRTEALEPANAFKLQVYGTKDCIAPKGFDIPATTDWREIALTFNSLQYDKVKVYAGLWGGKSGKFWLDDFRIEELALVNVLRRPGTPVTVKSADGQTVYEEGKDYERIADDKMSFWKPRGDNPVIRLVSGSRIADGQTILVSYYYGMAINDGQVTVCMSEPRLYELWRESAAAIVKHLDPDKWFLSMDEIRAGGSCAACKARHLSMAEILGDCITRQVNIIKGAKPGAMVYIWSDMLDPNHNAHGNYYLVDGDFTGSWTHVPRDLVISCWYFEKREPSLKFFSELGFQTQAAAYYDGDTLDNIKGWLETCNRTPACRGIMYTTWRDKYTLLPDFGDWVSGNSRPVTGGGPGQPSQ